MPPHPLSFLSFTPSQHFFLLTPVPSITADAYPSSCLFFSYLPFLLLLSLFPFLSFSPITKKALLYTAFLSYPFLVPSMLHYSTFFPCNSIWFLRAGHKRRLRRLVVRTAIVKRSEACMGRRSSMGTEATRRRGSSHMDP